MLPALDIGARKGGCAARVAGSGLASHFVRMERSLNRAGAEPIYSRARANAPHCCCPDTLSLLAAGVLHYVAERWGYSPDITLRIYAHCVVRTNRPNPRGGGILGLDSMRSV